MERPNPHLEAATFAGGCFWCMVKPFMQLDGVKKVISGYTGGHKEGPTYAEVCAGTTGHYEAVQVLFDPETVDYRKLLEIYWRQIDPTDPGGQFADRGLSYQTAIFYHSERQLRAAESSKNALNKSGLFTKPIATKILPAATFYPAEEYHQDYYLKNPKHYNGYFAGSGRSAFIQKQWDNKVSSDKNGLRMKLSDLQYEVTQNNATEPPFHNDFWNNQRAGLYVDIVSGIPLFSSKDKFDSGCGWPSFSRPLEPEAVKEKSDRSHGMMRTEVRSLESDSHLGHVFDDGPAPTGLRYCINSAALHFIPVDKLVEEGYGEYLWMFEKS